MVNRNNTPVPGKVKPVRKLRSACSIGWFVSLLVREEVLLVDLCEKKILFRLKIYNRFPPAKQALMISSKSRYAMPNL